MKIAVVGLGYVGLSLATLLSAKYEVVAFDINSKKVDLINKRISPIKDSDIEEFFKTKKLNLKATLDYKEAFINAEYIIICTPTNFDDKTNSFDTKSISDVVKKIKEINIDSTIIIKSTVPIGFTEKLRKKHKLNILFSPEFSREGKSLYDNLYPTRIIIGDTSDKAKTFGKLLLECSYKDDVVVKYMKSSEAEAVKLFSNTYLALRISYFNELDTFAEVNNLNTKDIIEGVCLDPRIANFYNNPSFGYGGYCLPKDTKQLNTSFNTIPQNMIESTVKSNITRKKHIAKMIQKKNPNVVGIYRLSMKKDSDNFRSSAILDIIDLLKESDIEVIIYEPTLETLFFNDCGVVNDIKKFEEVSDIIILNRVDDMSLKFTKEVYTRDLFYRD